jgi:ABC-type bacteriocin/lantibiotic exporter with double-glycine peptidase domain
MALGHYLERVLLNIVRFHLNQTALGRSFKVLPPSDRRKVVLVVLLQISIGVLDLLGVIAIGLLGALSVAGLQSVDPGNQINSALRLLRLSESTFQFQATVIGICAVFLLVGRTIISVMFTRRILKFLSRSGALISARLISRLLAQPLLTIQRNTTQETLFAITEGVSIITLRILGTAVVMSSDISLLLILGLGLLIIDPITAVSTFLLFAIIGAILYHSMTVRAQSLGTISTTLIISSNEKIVEVMSSYRESVVRNRRDFYAREIGKIRLELADLSAHINFLPYISKYVIETSIVLGALLLSAIQFVLQDAAHAVATLAIFLAAGSRIAPAVLRIQQGSIQIINGMGSATPTFELIEKLGHNPMAEREIDVLDTTHSGFIPEIQITNLTLTYPNSSTPAIANLSLTIPSGTFVAIVGPSGAGKTTFIDLLLGVIEPDEGQVLLSGLPPLLAVAKWPGAVSYVPQDVVINSGTIWENVSLGYPREEVTFELVMKALQVAHLDQFVAELPLGLEAQVGEHGAKISGGQRQRLGIARAMFTCPNLLVLDEATSSLDGITEVNITEAMQALRGSATIVMSAHRLSTIRNADMVVYLAGGRIMAQGSFDEVRRAIPDFDRQAGLLGL